MMLNILAACALTAQAGTLYKCKTVNGYSYQDAPCQSEGTTIKGPARIDPAEAQASRLREARQQLAFDKMQREREYKEAHGRLLASQDELLRTLDNNKRNLDQQTKENKINRCKTLSALASSAEQRERKDRNFANSQMAQSARGRYMNECQ